MPSFRTFNPTSVHAFRDPPDLAETFRRQVPAVLHHQNDTPKRNVILTLSGLEFMLIEKRDDPLGQVFHFPHPPAHAITVVPPNDPAPEMVLDRVENFGVALMLDDDELWKYLDSEGHFRMPGDPDVEAAFPVSKPDNPLSFELHVGTPARTSSL